MQLIKQIIKSRNGVFILYSNVVDGPTIYTHSLLTIHFGHQQHRHSTLAYAHLDPALLHHFFNLRLYLLRLLRVSPIGWPIRKACSWDEIYVVLYSP